ncbi:hypothetical protein LWI28_005024 [Acer negundo]|uniref:D-isomer specific 2-hydroxyacid dehydrogenase catalytic domain-containing protein n=1 Tax=Acer negundo TaxID=4023 RepID=A0AAD5IUS8_ACENE|nr:hypothetical protein LWI28_005024 [Acer negundo]
MLTSKQLSALNIIIIIIIISLPPSSTSSIHHRHHHPTAIQSKQKYLLDSFPFSLQRRRERRSSIAALFVVKGCWWCLCPPSFHFPFKDRLSTHFNLLDPLDSPDSTHFVRRHANSKRVLLCVDPTPISSDLLDLLPSLQLIVGSSVGVDHLDLSDCRRGGIAITNAGVAFSEDVADLAVGLLIDVLCGISAADRFVRSGFWANTGDYPLGFKLGGNWDCGIGKYWLSSCKET